MRTIRRAFGRGFVAIPVLYAASGDWRLNPLARLALWIMAAFVAGVMALAPASAAGHDHSAHGGHVQHVHAPAAPAPLAAKAAAPVETVLRAASRSQGTDQQSLCHATTSCAGAAPCCGALWLPAQDAPAPPAPVFGRTAPPGPPFARGTDPSGLLRPPKTLA